MENGASLIMQALGSTAIIFSLHLSAYALTSKKDFSFHGWFPDDRYDCGVIIAMIANIFLQIPI